MERSARSRRTADREVTIYTRLRGGGMSKGVSYDATSGALCLPSGRLAAAPESAKFAPKRRLGSGQFVVVGPCYSLPARETDTCLPNSDYPVRSEFRECPGVTGPLGLCKKGETPCVEATYQGTVWVASCRNPYSARPLLCVGRGRPHSTPRHSSTRDDAFGDPFMLRKAKQSLAPGPRGSWSARDQGPYTTYLHT